MIFINEDKISRYKSGIYKITNKTNGRVYIGSAKSIKRRYMSHVSNLSKNKHINIFLQNDFNKCGLNNFVFETIEFCTVAELLKFEQKYLDLYYDNQKQCYNIASQAQHSRLETKLNSEQKRRLSESHKGQIVSEEQKQKISTAHKERYAKMSKIDKEKFFSTITRKGKENNRAKTVLQFDLQENFIKKYETIKQAQLENNILSHTSITSCCSGKLKTAYGFIWKYEFPISDIEKIYRKKQRDKKLGKKATEKTKQKLRELQPKGKDNIKARAILQFNLQGKFIKKYDCIVDALKENNWKTHTPISFCCQKRSGRRSAYGFMWEYYSDNPNCQNIKPYARKKKSKEGPKSEINKKKISNGLRKRSRKIAQYDLSDNLIKIWNSIADAVDAGFTSSNISMSCRGINKTSKGFIWKYYEQNAS